MDCTEPTLLPSLLSGSQLLAPHIRPQVLTAYIPSMYSRVPRNWDREVLPSLGLSFSTVKGEEASGGLPGCQFPRTVPLPSSELHSCPLFCFLECSASKGTLNHKNTCRECGAYHTLNVLPNQAWVPGDLGREDQGRGTQEERQG